jgi:hypothetical protein
MQVSFLRMRYPVQSQFHLGPTSQRSNRPVLSKAGSNSNSLFSGPLTILGREPDPFKNTIHNKRIGLG